MKRFFLSAVAVGLVCFARPLRAQVPGIINYQGRVATGGTNFNGTGQFKFALVNSGGTTNYWSNDGTAVGQPAAAVSLAVTKGLYSVLLGDTTIANMTAAVAPTIFTNVDVRLRAWFNDGISGFQQLNPDQRLAAAGYAMMAAAVNSGGDIVGNRLKIGVAHTLNGELVSIAGGSNNTAQGYYSTIGGGVANNVGTFSSGNFLGGGMSNSIETLSGFCVLGGGFHNAIAADTAVPSSYSVLVGGSRNLIGPESGVNVIVGGFSNTIEYATSHNFIGGGSRNSILANTMTSVLGGGAGNSIHGSGLGRSACVLAGGSANTVDADCATVPGGANNTASGTYSFAAGRRAKALHEGAFVWGDAVNADISSTASNQFLIRATGGVGINTNNPAGYALNVAGSIRCVSLSQSSDRNLKENFSPVNPREVLAGVAGLPITQWNFKSDARAHHLGPTAQDFTHTFGLGTDETSITTLDADGVALAAIQGLYQELKEEQAKGRQKDAMIAGLMKQLAEMDQRIQAVSHEVHELQPAPQSAANVRSNGGM